MDILRILYLVIIVFLSDAFASGATFGIETFLIPSILMGLGVAIDVALATVTKFQDKNLSWRNWTLPVTLTHTFFPAFGYFLFWSLNEAFPVAHALLGIIGFTLVVLFVYEVVSEKVGKEPIFGISSWIGKHLGYSDSDARTLVAVLAVSWDALWSGPAKAAQAAAGSWNAAEVLLSFVVAGVVVAIVAEIALAIATYLRKREYGNTETIGLYSIIGTYFELAVIGGFGVLALWNAFSPAADLYASISIAAILLLFVFVPGFKKMKQTSLL